VCKFAKEAGINPGLIKEAFELADMLDLVEELSLKEWYLKQRGSNTNNDDSS